MNYGLIGEKLGHSFSKEIHTEFGRYVYQHKELSLEELGTFMTEKPFKCINVTIPYKEKVMPYLDYVSDQAKRIGAVNTIVNKDGKLYGYNTDYYGFTYMLNRVGVQVNGKVVAILGTGGAGKTARVALEDLGAKEIICVSRTGEINYQTVKEKKDIQVIVNTTPVGMYPNNGGCLIDLKDYPLIEGVVDMVYNPFVTELLFRAKQLGVKMTNGLSMLVAQAKRACEIFLDEKLPDTEIERVVKIVRNKTCNVTLVGMPGCGKSSVGKLVANLLDREFIDTDEAFEREYGVSPGECITRYGENYFRDNEQKVVLSVVRQSRKVVATGGGAVLREENQKNIQSNSIVVWLKRDIDALSTNDRPLSKSKEELERLYENRAPIYERISDIIVENVGSVYDVAQTVVEKINGFDGE